MEGFWWEFLVNRVLEFFSCRSVFFFMCVSFIVYLVILYKFIVIVFLNVFDSGVVIMFVIY